MSVVSFRPSAWRCRPTSVRPTRPTDRSAILERGAKTRARAYNQLIPKGVFLDGVKVGSRRGLAMAECGARAARRPSLTASARDVGDGAGRDMRNRGVT